MAISTKLAVKLTVFQGLVAQTNGIIFDAKVKFGNIEFKYATLSNIVKFVTPLLNKAGLAFVQRLEDDKLITEIIDSESGDSIKSIISLNFADKKPQEIGALLTYFKRYELASILGIVADEDKDALPFEQQQKPAKTKATVSIADIKNLPDIHVEETTDVIIVSGKTYGYQAMLKDLGFTFNPNDKSWIKSKTA